MKTQRRSRFAFVILAAITSITSCGDEPRDERDQADDDATGDEDAGASTPGQDAAAGGEERPLDGGSERADASASNTSPRNDGGRPPVGEAPGPDASSGGGARDGSTAPPPADAAVSTGTPTWSMGTVMPTKRTELAVAELDGKIYVAGGYGGLTSFEAYDPASDRWEMKAALPAGGRQHPSLAAIDGMIYMMGGSSTQGAGNTSETFAYDPRANSWMPKAPMLHARYAAAAVTLNGAIYVVGGQGPSNTVMQRYDPKANSWSASAQLSMMRDHLAAVALDGKIYALGGRPGLGAVYETVEIYDPQTNRFTAGPSMTEGRSGFGAAAVNGKIYAAGGEVLVQPFFVRDTAEVFDPASNKWTAIAKLSGPLHGIGAAAFGGKMYVFGGCSMPANSTPRLGGVNILTP